jgi:hypothetical protein
MMRNRYLLILFVIYLVSCVDKHKKEAIVNGVIKTDIDTIDLKNSNGIDHSKDSLCMTLFDTCYQYNFITQNYESISSNSSICFNESNDSIISLKLGNDIILFNLVINSEAPIHQGWDGF